MRIVRTELPRTNPVERAFDPWYSRGMNTKQTRPPKLPFSEAELHTRRLLCDPEDNGKYIIGVRTTGIYCLPSCRPPRMAKAENITFYATPEEARAAGLRACKL